MGGLICLPVVGVVRYFSWMSRWVGKNGPRQGKCLDRYAWTRTGDAWVLFGHRLLRIWELERNMGFFWGYRDGAL